MKNSLLSFPLVLIYLLIHSSSFAQQPTYLWANSIGGAYNDNSSDIIADNNGNVYLIGTTRGVIDLDPGPGTFIVTADTSRGKMFLAKYDNSGNFLWADLWDKGIYDGAYTLEFFPNGDIMITGYYDFIVDMDPGPGIVNLNANGSLLYFVLRLTPAGNFVWVKDFAGMFNTPKIFSKIDGAGNIYIAGFFSQTRDFDPGPAIFSMSAVSRDIFLMKLTTAGNFVWAVKCTGTLNNWVNGIALSPTNDIIITGTFSGTTDFDPGSGVNSLTAGTTIGDEDFYIAKYSNAGALMWVRQFEGGSIFNAPAGVCADNDGIIYIAGWSSANTDFDPGPGTLLLSGTFRYLLKLDANGDFYSVTGFDNSIYFNNITIDNQKNVYLTGNFSNTFDADPGPAVYTLTSDSIGFGVFIITLDSTSNLLWADAQGGHIHVGVQQNAGISVYIDPSGSVYFTGRYEDATLNFGPIAIQNATPWTLSYTDIYFGKIESLSTHVNVLQNDDVSISIYPNPSHGSTTINCKNGFAEIKIYDAQGKLVVLENRISNNFYQFNMVHFQTGIYFVQIKDLLGFVHTKKLIVER